MADLLVPGFDVVELLGFGSGGEVWLGREHSTGESVALKRLHAGADLAARDRLRREAAVLAGVDHPHVVRLRSVVGAGESLVLVLDLAAGGSLARLLATRGRLSPGEVVTLAVPLAQALAAVHAQGVVHGDVTPANVLFAADGRPVLSDLGVARLLGAPHPDPAGTSGFLDPAVASSGEPGPASDVHGLAATCLAALTGHPPYDESGARVGPSDGGTVLIKVLESALAPDPDDRPGADELASAVFEAAAAEPVQLGWMPAAGPAGVAGALRPAVPAPDPAMDPLMDPVMDAGQRPTHRVGAHRGGAAGAGAAEGDGAGAGAVGAVARRALLRWRTGLVVLLGATAVAMAGVTAVLWAGGGAHPAPAQGAAGSAAAGAVARPAEPPAARPSDRSWAGILASLDAARSGAFAAADPARLAGVYVPGSPALRRDRSALDRLAATGLRARGLRLTAVDVALLARDRGRVQLQVEDVMPAFVLVDPAGAVVERRTGRARQRWEVTLARVGESWLVYDVARG